MTMGNVALEREAKVGVRADDTVRDVPALSPESLAGLTVLADEANVDEHARRAPTEDDEATRERRRRFAKIVMAVMGVCGVIGVAAVGASLVRVATADDTSTASASNAEAARAIPHVTSAALVVVARDEAAPPVAAPAPDSTTKSNGKANKPGKPPVKNGAFGAKPPARTMPPAKTKSR